MTENTGICPSAVPLHSLRYRYGHVQRRVGTNPG